MTPTQAIDILVQTAKLAQKAEILTPEDVKEVPNKDLEEPKGRE